MINSLENRRLSLVFFPRYLVVHNINSVPDRT